MSEEKKRGRGRPRKNEQSCNCGDACKCTSEQVEPMDLHSAMFEIAAKICDCCGDASNFEKLMGNENYLRALKALGDAYEQSVLNKDPDLSMLVELYKELNCADKEPVAEQDTEEVEVDSNYHAMLTLDGEPVEVMIKGGNDEFYDAVSELIEIFADSDDEVDEDIEATEEDAVVCMRADGSFNFIPLSKFVEMMK